MPRRRNKKQVLLNMKPDESGIDPLVRLPIAKVVSRSIETHVDTETGEVLGVKKSNTVKMERGRFVLLYIDYVEIFYHLSEKAIKIFFGSLDYLLYETHQLNITKTDWMRIAQKSGIKTDKTMYKYRKELKDRGVIYESGEHYYINEYLIHFGKSKKKQHLYRTISSFVDNNGVEHEVDKPNNDEYKRTEDE